jgi:hypothetical protein
VEEASKINEGLRRLAKATGVAITPGMSRREVSELVSASTTIPDRYRERADRLGVIITEGMTLGALRVALAVASIPENTRLCEQLGYREGQVIKRGDRYYLIKFIREGKPRLKQLVVLSDNKFKRSSAPSKTVTPQALQGNAQLIEGAIVIN